MLIQGTTVIELATVITGPYAGMLLADLGADVIKVEAPPGGDPFRDWDGVSEGPRPAFAAYNRGKRSVALNLRSPDGVAVFHRLLEHGDVVIENMRPGAMDRLGLGWPELSARHPRLVYCGITGRPTGLADSASPTYDAVAQALSGMWSQLVDLTDPVPVGPPMADQLTGMYAAIGILAALKRRDATGTGSRIEIDMLTSCLSFQGLSVASLIRDNVVPDKATRARNSQAYGFIAGDGRPFCIHLSTARKFWLGLCQAVGHPELGDDPRFNTKAGRVARYDELREILAAFFKGGTRDRWLAALDEQDVPAAPILDLAEAMAQPWVTQTGIVSAADGDGLDGFARSPVRLDGRYVGELSRLPRYGQDTADVLRSLGYADGAISELAASGVVGQ